ncbi:MAG: hypothetical protein AAB506_01055 [Patescibacteria group bacterium]
MKYIKKFWSENKKIIEIFLFWRFSLLFIGFVSINILPFKASFPYIDETLISSGFPQWLWQWGNFDGVHYLTIAQHGYLGLVNNEQVFFPLYPLLIKLLYFLTQNYLASGLLISNFSILFAAIVLNKITKNIWPVIFLFSFPTAFFFGSIYTESLFLLLILLTFYKSKFFGFLAGLTRLTGFFTGIFGVLGVTIYMLYLKLEFNNPLLFLFNQGGFNNARANNLFSLVTPPQVIFRYFKIFTTADPANIAFWVSVLEFSSFVFGIGLLTWLTIHKKIPVSWLIFSWAALLLPSFSGTFASIPRYLLTIFPIFICLGSIKNQSLRLATILIFAILQVVLTVLFVRGYFIA